MRRLHPILLVEDNVADVKITQRAFRESNLPVDLIVVRDGQEALDYLLQLVHPADGSSWRMPELILLDINLPVLGGQEVLQRLRSHSRFAALPVVVLTTSRHCDDVRRMYTAGANSYIEKPTDFHRFVQTLQVLYRYWLEVAVLPSLQE